MSRYHYSSRPVRPPRAIRVDVESVIGSRIPKEREATVAHWHARTTPDVDALLLAMRGYALAGKIVHTRNEYLGLDRYEFSDGSMLVSCKAAPVIVVDIGDSVSLRAYFQRMHVFAVQEALHIRDKQSNMRPCATHQPIESHKKAPHEPT